MSQERNGMWVVQITNGPTVGKQYLVQGAILRDLAHGSFLASDQETYLIPRVV